MIEEDLGPTSKQELYCVAWLHVYFKNICCNSPEKEMMYVSAFTKYA
jgi:hypothetical protein